MYLTKLGAYDAVRHGAWYQKSEYELFFRQFMRGAWRGAAGGLSLVLMSWRWQSTKNAPQGILGEMLSLLTKNWPAVILIATAVAGIFFFFRALSDLRLLEGAVGQSYADRCDGALSPEYREWFWNGDAFLVHTDFIIEVREIRMKYQVHTYVKSGKSVKRVFVAAGDGRVPDRFSYDEKYQVEYRQYVRYQNMLGAVQTVWIAPEVCGAFTQWCGTRYHTARQDAF